MLCCLPQTNNLIGCGDKKYNVLQKTKQQQ